MREKQAGVLMSTCPRTGARHTGIEHAQTHKADVQLKPSPHARPAIPTWRRRPRHDTKGAEQQDYHFDLSAVRQLLHGVRVFCVVLQQDRHLERGCLRGPHMKGREKQNLNTGENSKYPSPKFEELIYKTNFWTDVKNKDRFKKECKVYNSTTMQHFPKRCHFPLFQTLKWFGIFF